MKIVSTSTEQYTRGIPLKGWDSVVTALNIFSRGFTKGSQGTQDHQMNALTQSSGVMGLGLYLITSQNMQAPSLFVREMLAEAESRVRQNGIWSKSYDYDGQGVFKIL